MTIPFRHRSETFGLEHEGWGFGAIRLLFSTPRSYEPLVRAWERPHPGTRRALNRLVDMGFVEHQGPIYVDLRTGEPATAGTREVPRYRLSTQGRALLRAWKEDSRAFEEWFPRTTPENLASIARLFVALDTPKGDLWGRSGSHLAALSGLPDRTCRWWITRLVESGHVRQLPFKHPDVALAIPQHWRPTRELARQVREITEHYDLSRVTSREFRLTRSKFLADIDPTRVGPDGGNDFEHDIHTQEVLATLIRSPRCAVKTHLTVEPTMQLPLFKSTNPWQFGLDGPHTATYQPDAEIRERQPGGVRRGIIEYERHQTRRDGWSHIERFLGWMATHCDHFDKATLRFVLANEHKVRSYVRLIEAFADYLMDNPDAAPNNDVILAVTSVSRLKVAKDPLDDREWATLALTRGTGTACAMHDPKDSPYDEYFTIDPDDDSDGDEVLSGEELEALAVGGWS